jgi:hypothetical protein
MAEPAQSSGQDAVSGSPAWDRLTDQLGWYEAKSQTAQQRYKQVKAAQLMFGAAVPVVVLAPGVNALVPAALGATVVVLEGLQQLHQWQANWIRYRSTAEGLKREKYLFLSRAGPYTHPDREQVLAERIEDQLSRENADWTEASAKTSNQPP